MAYTWSTGRIKVKIGGSTWYRQQGIEYNEYPTKAQRGVQRRIGGQSLCRARQKSEKGSHPRPPWTGSIIPHCIQTDIHNMNSKPWIVKDTNETLTLCMVAFGVATRLG